MAPTPTQRLVEDRLGGPVADYIHPRRNRARPASWRLIARDLHADTGIDVTPETLRTWATRPLDAVREDVAS